jgi:simple sugar transport system ATP-binding protein
MHVGSILEYSVSENLVLDKFNSSRFSKGLFMNQSEIDKYAKKLVSDFGIRTPSINVPVKQLSGGNLQKIVLARELSSNPKLIIVHNPTNGLDVGAIEYVHQTLIENRKKGAAILLISTELEEILSLSDRITVLYEGEMMGMIPRDEVDVEKLGLMMGGSKLDSNSQKSKGEQR